MSSLAKSWRIQLAGGFFPAWLEDFAQNVRPQSLLNDFLEHRVALGPLQALEPEYLILEWLDILGEDGFRERLDEALTAWIREEWGNLTLEGQELSRQTGRWSAALTVACMGRGLASTTLELLGLFEEAHEFLGPLSQSPSRDPLGSFLGLVARHQVNRDLAAFWWQMCELPPGMPYFHAVCAIAGLRGLPPEVPADAGGFRKDVLLALLKLADAFARQASAGTLLAPLAEREFLRVGRITMAAYPFPRLWRENLAIELDPGSIGVEYLEKLLPGVTWSPSIESILAGAPSLEIDENWPFRATKIAHQLQQTPESAVSKATALLAEQRRFAEAGGNIHFLSRSLRNFSTRIRDYDPTLSLSWGSEARNWDPHDPYSWTTLGEALAANNQLVEAEIVYRQACERFPRNLVANTGLADILKLRGELNEAELIYREISNSLPPDVFVGTGLADVLKLKGNLEEAEQIYRKTLDDFPREVVPRNGLAEVKKLQGNLEEAERLYRLAYEHFPQNVRARAGLAEVLRQAGKIGEAIALYEDTVKLFPRNAVARTGLAFIRLQLGQLTEARSLFKAVLLEFPANTYARTGLQQTHEEMKQSGNITEAELLPLRSEPDTSDSLTRSNPFQHHDLFSATTGTGARELDSGLHQESGFEQKAIEHILKKATPTRESLPRGERTWRLYQSRSLRRLASTLPSSSGEKSRILERASGLLEEILRAVPYDLPSIGEKAFLLIELGRIAEATVLVESALGAQIFAPDLIALRAFLVGKDSNEKSSIKAPEILNSLKMVASLFGWASPMTETLALRYLIAISSDEDIVLSKLTSVYDWWLSWNASGEFNQYRDDSYQETHNWMAGVLGKTVLDGLKEANVSDYLRLLRLNFSRHSAQLDELSERFVLQLRAQLEIILPTHPLPSIHSVRSGYTA